MRYSLLLENVIIAWATASESNNDYFTVERSKDGISFEAIVEVDGAGNSDNYFLNYKVTDFSPFEGTSYYRLKQTDFDGKFALSDVKAVNFNNPLQTPLWSVFPNPTSLNGVFIKNTNINANKLS